MQKKLIALIVTICVLGILFVFGYWQWNNHLVSKAKDDFMQYLIEMGRSEEIESIEVGRPWYSLSKKDWKFSVTYAYYEAPVYYCFKNEEYAIDADAGELSRMIKLQDGPWYGGSPFTHMICSIDSQEGNEIILEIVHMTEKDSCGWDMQYKAGDIIRVYFDEAYVGEDLLSLPQDDLDILKWSYKQVEIDAQYIVDIKDGVIHVKRIQCNNPLF